MIARLLLSDVKQTAGNVEEVLKPRIVDQYNGGGGGGGWWW